MITRLSRKGAVIASASLCMVLPATFLALHTGCGTNPDAYKNPTPAISAFDTGSIVGGKFLKTPDAVAPLKIAVDGSVLFRANFAVKDGKAVVTPGNIPVTSNIPFTIPSIHQTTTFTLTVTSGTGLVSTATAQVVVLPPPTGLSYTDQAATYYKGVQIVPNNPLVSGGGVYTYSYVAKAPAAPSTSLPSPLSLDPATGIISGTPTGTSGEVAYTITAKDAVNQSTTTDITIKVEDTPLAFALNPPAIAPTGTSVLSWDANVVSGVFSSVNITAAPADATLPATFLLSGSANVSPAGTTNYTISATPTHGGANVVRTIGLTVGNAAVALTSFDASPLQTNFGGTSDLTWAYTGLASTLTLDGASVLGSTGTTVHPVRRHTYVLTGANILNNGTPPPSTLTKTVAARGLDNYLGSPVAGGYLEGTGSAAKFSLNSTPIASSTAGSMNLSMDPSGNLLVPDAQNHVVRMVSSTGVTSFLAGKPGVAFINAAADGTGSGNGTAARFNRPAQVLYVDANNMYVIDYGTNSLRLMTKQGDGTWTVSAAAGTPGTYGNATTQNLDNPLSIASYNSKIYIADGYTSSIRVFDPAAVGNKLSTLAGGGSGQQFGLLDATGTAARMRTCSSIQIDPSNGDIYVADRENHAIRKVTQTGVVTTIAGAYPTATAGNVDASGTNARFNRPTGILRAADGTLYVTDNNNHTIRKMVYNSGTSAWDVTTILGTGTAGNVEGVGTAAAFNGPEGITMDSDGNLYVADAANFRIRKVTITAGPVYTTSAFAGSRVSGLVNGNGLATRFAIPNGVAVDKNDVIYVADEGNKVIRKIATDGTATTWGTGVTLTAPYTLTVDDNLNVYVLDRLAAGIAVVKIDPSGTMTTVTLTGATFANNNPRGMAVTSDGASLFLADGNYLRKFNLTTGAQSASITTGLSSVNGIATATDFVYWVEYGSHVIKKAALDLTGAAIVAGTSTTRGFVDGDATTTARFYQPAYLTLAKNGSGSATKIFVVDQGNHALRQIDLGSSLVSTLVGRIDMSFNPPSTSGIGLPAVFSAIPGTLGATGTSGLYFPKGVGINSLGDLFVSTSDGIMQVTAP